MNYDPQSGYSRRETGSTVPRAHVDARSDDFVQGLGRFRSHLSIVSHERSTIAAPTVPQPPEPLDWTERIPYLLELRDCCDSALASLEALQGVAKEWTPLRLAAMADLNKIGPELRDTLPLQRSTFDLLETFLATWSRISLLIFPIESRNPAGEFAKRRGSSLRDALALGFPDAVQNRALRDSWMHHDERLDLFVQGGRTATPQRFTLSHQVTEQDLRTTLRLVEMDTLRVHFLKRDGSPDVCDLRELTAALLDLQDKVREAWKKKLPSDSPA